MSSDEGVFEAMVRVMAECRERSIVQVLEEDFGVHIYGMCMGPYFEGAPSVEDEELAADQFEAITNAVSVVFSDMSLTTSDAAVMIAHELDFFMDEMPGLHFHSNDYFDDDDGCDS